MFSDESGLFFIVQLKWLFQHAKWDRDRRAYICQDSGAEIQSTVVIRSFHDALGESLGAVWPVHHMYCPAHTAPAFVCKFDPVRINHLSTQRLPRA